MIVRKLSLLSTAAWLLAFVLVPMQVAAQDYDLDGTLDASDACPHIAGATPGLMAAPHVILDYGNTGPGGGDDSVVLRGLGAFFLTLAPYDPDSVDNVHVTFRRNTTTGLDLWATTLAAGPPWTQRSLGSRGHQQWDYNAPAPGVTTFKGLVRNALAASFGSGLNRLTIKKARDTNVAGPLGADDVTVILELENTIESPYTGDCFFSTSTTCTSSPGKDNCLP